MCWTTVTERLPTCYTTVAVLTRTGDLLRARLSHADPPTWIDDRGDVVIPFFWIPLPWLDFVTGVPHDASPR